MCDFSVVEEELRRFQGIRIPRGLRRFISMEFEAVRRLNGGPLRTRS